MTKRPHRAARSPGRGPGGSSPPLHTARGPQDPALPQPRGLTSSCAHCPGAPSMIHACPGSQPHLPADSLAGFLAGASESAGPLPCRARGAKGRETWRPGDLGPKAPRSGSPQLLHSPALCRVMKPRAPGPWSPASYSCAPSPRCFCSSPIWNPEAHCLQIPELGLLAQPRRCLWLKERDGWDPWVAQRLGTCLWCRL